MATMHNIYSKRDADSCLKLYKLFAIALKPPTKIPVEQHGVGPPPPKEKVGG